MIRAHFSDLLDLSPEQRAAIYDQRVRIVRARQDVLDRSAVWKKVHDLLALVATRLEADFIDENFAVLKATKEAIWTFEAEAGHAVTRVLASGGRGYAGLSQLEKRGIKEAGEEFTASLKAKEDDFIRDEAPLPPDANPDHEPNPFI